MLRCLATIATTFYFCAAGSAQAQQPPSPTGAPPPPPPPPAPFATSGPWSFTGLANVDVLGDALGGAHRGVKLLTKTALSAGYDGSQDDHDGWGALVSAQLVEGGRLSARNVGDAQGVDNIEAVNALRLYEAWVSRDIGDRAGVKLGFIDLNVDFDTQEVGALFLNSSDGTGPELGHSGLNGPSVYPRYR